jgi:lysophospholipase L1-like esterase
MKKTVKWIGIVLGLLVLALVWPAWKFYGEIEKARSEDPTVWEDDVVALESGSQGLLGAGEGVVFIGSSSIRFWDSLTEDMSPLKVIQHGFGGAKLGDVVYYAQRLVNAWQPRAVVVFAGTNDIAPSASKTPAVLLASYQAFVAEVRADQPEVPIYFIGITPSPLRWEVWPIAQSTNALIETWSKSQPNLFYISTSDALLDANGKPDSDNYRFDGLHLSEQGYAIWREIIRGRLLDDLGSTAPAD